MVPFVFDCGFMKKFSLRGISVLTHFLHIHVKLQVFIMHMLVKGLNSLPNKQI